MTPPSAEPEVRRDGPLVLLLSQDLFFQPRLQDALGRLGCRVILVDSPQALGADGLGQERAVPLTEPLSGGDAAMMRQLTELRPGLILVDLTAAGLPWARWIQTLKTSAATRRIPIVAFGPHVEEAAFEQARAAGADRVLPRGQITKSLPRLVKDVARQIDEAALAEACRQPLSDLARRGIELHNQGEYFEAHELLEEAWMAEEEEAGYLYRALLQLDVAHLHMVRGNLRGAQKMMLRLHQWLDPLPSRCRGVNVDDLRSYGGALRQNLLSMTSSDLEHAHNLRFPSIEIRQD